MPTSRLLGFSCGMNRPLLSPSKKQNKTKLYNKGLDVCQVSAKSKFSGKGVFFLFPMIILTLMFGPKKTEQIISDSASIHRTDLCILHFHMQTQLKAELQGYIYMKGTAQVL